MKSFRRTGTTPDKPVRLRYLTGTQDFDNACEEWVTNSPAFKKVDQTYDLEVEETFMRRLPPRSRGDYGLRAVSGAVPTMSLRA